MKARIQIEIAMDNAAFDESPIEELTRILRVGVDRIGRAVELGDDRFHLFDINGNRVGFFDLDLREDL
jgi:hypothetical protein